MSDERLERSLRSALTNGLYDALVGRGHSASDIASMNANDRFDEYCGWHLGDRRWGEDLRATWKLCSFDEETAGA